LRFTSLAVTSLWRDLHPQVCAHAGRTMKKALWTQVQSAFKFGGTSGGRTHDKRIKSA